MTDKTSIDKRKINGFTLQISLFSGHHTCMNDTFSQGRRINDIGIKSKMYDGAIDWELGEGKGLHSMGDCKGTRLVFPIQMQWPVGIDIFWWVALRAASSKLFTMQPLAVLRQLPITLFIASIAWVTVANPIVLRDELLHLTPEDFKHRITSGPSFVEFYSPACHHCRNFAPTWEALVKTAKMNMPSVLLAQVNCAMYGGEFLLSRQRPSTQPRAL